MFAQSLAAGDQVALEATGNALSIARVIEPHVGRVVLANPKAAKNATRSAKTDKLDARTLAKLLAAGFLPEVWSPDERTRVLRRRISRRAQLVRQRMREKNQVHAILIRNLKGRAPAAELFGSAGRRWLGEQELPVDEREMLEACLRGIDFLDREVAAIDRALAELVLASAELRRLLTLPGVNVVAACVWRTKTRFRLRNRPSGTGSRAFLYICAPLAEAIRRSPERRYEPGRRLVCAVRDWRLVGL